MDVEFKVEEVIDLKDFLLNEVSVGAAPQVPQQPMQPDENESKIDELMHQNKDITRECARICLRKTNSNVLAASEWFNNNRESVLRIVKKVAAVEATNAIPTPEIDSTEFRLVAMIDHIGDTINIGHAVAYVRKLASDQLLRSSTVPSPNSDKSESIDAPAQSESTTASTTNEQNYRWFEFDDHFVSLIENSEPHLMPPIKMAQTYFYLRIKPPKSSGN